MSLPDERPNPLVGHEVVQLMLERAVTENRVHHAYLFSGPARVGKSTLGRWLAARLECPNDPAPCGHCRVCARIEKAIYPDVRSLQLPGERDLPLGLALDPPERLTKSAERVIGIEQVRALQHDASLAPNEGPWKVYLISGAEYLSLPAANCLLKTLEEPPSRVVIILTVVDANELMSTLISRCQSIRLGLVPRAEIAAWLEERHGCPSERADLLARLSGGRPGWALEALTNGTLITERDRLLEDLAPTLRPGYRQRLGLAEKLASGYSRDPRAVLQTLAAWQVWWWDVQLLQRNCVELITNVDRRGDLDALAQATTPESVRAYLGAIGDASRRLLANVNPRLALEALLLQSPAVP